MLGQMAGGVTYRSVKAVKPAAGYVGGKKQLARRIIGLIDAIPHDTYAEPFVGMGGVFFRRERIPRGEVINDLSGDVATFFRVLQRHYVPFVEMLRWQITGRREFERLKASNPSTLTDMERAARFLYLQRTAFGGKVTGRTFGVDPLGSRFNISKLAPLLDDLHERLTGVTVESLPWQEFIVRYDRPSTLFFIDPPYMGNEEDYGPDMFSPEDYPEMAAVLRRLQGRFILTLNDVPAVRDTFAGFPMKSAGLTYTVSRGAGIPARELLITSPVSHRAKRSNPRAARG